jgi:hypothetical protein
MKAKKEKKSELAGTKNRFSTGKKYLKLALLMLVLLFVIALLFKPHISQLKYCYFSYRENIVSTTELNNFYLNDGDRKELINNAIKQDYTINLDGEIEKFGTLFIGKGDNRWNSSYVQLTNDSVFVFNKTDSIRKSSFKHNLLINNQLKIKINQKLDSANIFIANTTDTFTVSTKFTGMDSPYVRSVGSRINVKDFSFSCDDYNDAVWIFGDSYVSCASPARWTYYIYNQRYDFFCDGLPGGKSIHAYDFLRTALTIDRPEYLIWCLGMNDGGDRFFAGVSWLIYLKKIEKLCKENEITLIFTTIPTCPKINNQNKNQYIRKSGYRYVDFEKAVSDGNGNWKAGMLLADGVHPTEKGAKALAEQFIKDFPEIKQYRKNM